MKQKNQLNIKAVKAVATDNEKMMMILKKYYDDAYGNKMGNDKST